MSGTSPTPRDWEAAIASMRSVGAVSPEFACRARDLPADVATQLTALLDRGVVREGASGTYYLYVSASGTTPPSLGARRAVYFNWRRFFLTLLFWITVILVPILFMVCNRAGR